MEITNELLIKIYMAGFNSELMCTSAKNYSLILKAFKLGGLDAKYGDDNPNHDYQTDEEIIKKIKQQC